MRYLKACAQDRSGNGKADTVLLHFYERHSNQPDDLIHEAVAVDMNADGVMDFQFAGETNDASNRPVSDTLLLKAFAEAFLKLCWCNQGENSQRVLVMKVAHCTADGLPNAVELYFFDRLSPGRKHALVFQAAGYDGDGNGVLESFTRTDVNKDGVANNADKELIRSMCNSFLVFEWYGEAGAGLSDHAQGAGQCAI